jgi:hypothetical protein
LQYHKVKDHKYKIVSLKGSQHQNKYLPTLGHAQCYHVTLASISAVSLCKLAFRMTAWLIALICREELKQGNDR